MKSVSEAVVLLLAAALMPQTATARFASVKINVEMAVAEEQHPLSEDMVRLCRLETDISMAELQKFRQHDFSNSSEATQCFAHCVYERMGLMRNGVFVERDAVNDLAYLADPKNFLIRECAAIKGENKCDTAFKIHQCRHGVQMRMVNKNVEAASVKTVAPIETAH